jgi:hypothetical protein
MTTLSLNRSVPLLVSPPIAAEESKSAALKRNVNALEIFIYSSFKVSVATTVQDTARVARGIVFIYLVELLDVRAGAASHKPAKNIEVKCESSVSTILILRRPAGPACAHELR